MLEMPALLRELRELMGLERMVSQCISPSEGARGLKRLKGLRWLRGLKVERAVEWKSLRKGRLKGRT